MGENDNIFDNSGADFPDITAGQEADTGAEDVSNTTTTPDDGQVVNDAAQTTNDGQAETSWSEEYKTPEEMYEALKKERKSYENLRPKFTKTAQELSTLKKSQQPKPAPVENNGQADPVKAILNYVDSAVAKVTEQSESIAMQNSVQQLRATYQDFDEVVPTILKMFEDDPAMWTTKNPLEKAYKLAKAEAVGKEVQKAVADAKKNAYADKEIKVLNSDAKTKAASVETPKTEAEMIRESILGVSARPKHIF